MTGCLLAGRLMGLMSAAMLARFLVLQGAGTTLSWLLDLDDRVLSELLVGTAGLERLESAGSGEAGMAPMNSSSSLLQSLSQLLAETSVRSDVTTTWLRALDLQLQLG